MKEREDMDKQMKEINVSELKKIQLNILDCFDLFCKQNNLKYWLDYGTLLGAVRHKGYIPWDDDIDIGMLREDYSKAEEIFNAQSKGLIEFKTPNIDKTYFYPFGKLIQTNTILEEYGSEGIRTGVYIDVFPYDNSLDDKKAAERMFKKRDYLGRLRRLQLPMRENLPLAKRVIFHCASLTLKTVSPNRINRAIDKNARKAEHEECNNVGSFTDTYTDVYKSKRLIVPKLLFEELTEMEFENKIYPVPANYDFWLKSLYGDYMILPPKEKRVAHHIFKAYYVNS